MKPPIMNIMAAIALATTPAYAAVYTGTLTSEAGFTEDDSDNANPPPSFYIDGGGRYAWSSNHLAVPDSGGVPIIPEPSTGLFGALGLLLILRRRVK